jgi:ribonuclease HI
LKAGSPESDIDFRDTILIYTDGACSGNPGRGGWGSIVVTPDGHVRELGGGPYQTTNNQMEMLAVTEALKAVHGKPGPVVVCTDSVYVIRGITQWIWGWMRNGWKTADGGDVSNKEYWQDLSAVVGQRKGRDKIRWRHVRGHSGIPGNERCDEIAVRFSQGQPIHLYDGPLLRYDVPVYDLPEDGPLPEGSSKKEKKPAYSYLSLIGGIPMRHSNWPDCERRVKGQPGAKFKKATSAEDERAILRSWGVDPASIK